MTSFEWGDVIIVRFPFTSLTEEKKRPAVIASTRRYNDSGSDVIAAAITSNLSATRRPGDFKIAEWKKAGLLKPSLCKITLFTIEESLIVKKLGKFAEKDKDKLSKGLKEALGL